MKKKKKLMVLFSHLPFNALEIVAHAKFLLGRELSRINFVVKH